MKRILLTVTVTWLALATANCTLLRGQDVYQQGKDKAVKGAVFYCNNVSLAERQANRADFNATFAEAMNSPNAAVTVNCGDE